MVVVMITMVRKHAVVMETEIKISLTIIKMMHTVM